MRPLTEPVNAVAVTWRSKGAISPRWTAASPWSWRRSIQRSRRARRCSSRLGLTPMISAADGGQERGEGHDARHGVEGRAQTVGEGGGVPPVQAGGADEDGEGRAAGDGVCCDQDGGGE